MNGNKIVLRDEDKAAPPDPQSTLIELAEMVGAHLGELELLRDLLTRWGTDPTGVCRRAQPRAVDLHEQAGRIHDLLLLLSQGYRAAGRLSAVYGADLGVRP